MRRILSDVSSSVGRGLLAGVAGTAAITASTMIEMKLRDRQPSSAPADAAAKVLDIEEFEDEDAKTRFGNLVHWGYGLQWGAVRGLLGATGLPPVVATLAHFGLVWGTELGMLPALDVAPPATEWGTGEVAIDVWHHAVYAAATGVAYEWLSSTS